MADITRSGSSVLAKLVSGVGENFGIPGSWNASMYGSGWPIAPVSQPQDDALPRTIDYPVSVNSTITPRISYGLMPFNALNTAYENVAEVKAPVSLITRELVGLVPHLVDQDGNPVDDHPYRWMTQSPDGKTPFGVWLTRLIKSTKVYDAPAVYLQRAQGKITGLHYIDGSTLFVILDELGNIPDPEPVRDYVQRLLSQGGSRVPAAPQLPGSSSSVGTLQDFAALYDARVQGGLPVPTKIPAYTQIIKGTPFSWWSSDDIWYMPQSRRMNAPYGDSFIEDAWAWIMVIVNITAFELGHYRTGNMPEGFVTVPNTLAQTTDQLLAVELAFNQRMAGNPTTERNRIRIFPDGSKYQETKKPDFPIELYKQAWNNVLNAIGVLPSDFGEMPGAGLGGGGFKKQATTDTSRQSINPNREFFASVFNAVLGQDGVDDVTFVLDYALEEIDPDKKRQSVFEGMAHGTLSLNDALGELNQTPIGSPTDKNNIANKHLIVAGASIFVVEDMQTQNGMAVPTLGPGAANQAGAAPINPETVVEQHGAEHTPQDNQTVAKLIQTLRDTGTLDGKFISVPSGKVFAPVADQPPSIIQGVASQPDPRSELHAWNNLVRRWGTLAKFTVHQLPEYVEAFIRAELATLPEDAPRSLRKALFDDVERSILTNTDKDRLRKDYDSIAEGFQSEAGDLFDGATDESDPTSATAFGSRYRSALRRSGLQMFRQGMEDNGVSPESLSPEQLKTFRDWQDQVSKHVSNLRAQVYGADSTLTDAQAQQRPAMWSNVSLRGIYYKGAASVAPDKRKVWRLGAAEQHCGTCSRNDGQVKTLAEWDDDGFPGDFEKLDCHGVHCDCDLIDPPERDETAEKFVKANFDPSQPRDQDGTWSLTEGWLHRDKLPVGDRTHPTTTLEGKFEADTGTPGETPESLNHFLRTSNGSLAYALLDPQHDMITADFSKDEPEFSVNKQAVKGEATAFVKESQNIQYGKDYLLSLAKDKASENGLSLTDSEVEQAFNQQYADRAKAIQTAAKVGNVSLTDAQERRLQQAADGHYLDLVYRRDNSENGSLVNAVTRRGGQKLSGAALKEARQNFRDWVTMGA